MTTYAQKANELISEKIILATIDSAELCKTFTLHSGSVYKKNVSYFVSKVKQGSSVLTEHTSNSLSAGRWFYDKQAKIIYIRTTDSANPNTKQITIFYRHFYSNAPINLPYDLSSGASVEWDGRIMQSGAINQALDSENTGIAIEVNTSLGLMNTDGHFDEIFDTLIWENKSIEIYSWIYGLSITEKKKIFSGIITEKSFTPDAVTFRAKDFTFKLRQLLNLSLFSTADGTLSDSDIGTPKRRIYGRARQVQCVGVDKILDGYDISLFATGTLGSSSVTTGSNTNKLYVGDEVAIELPNGELLELTIDDIISTTSFSHGDNLETSFSNAPVYLKPSNGYRLANRNWLVSGHKLFERTYNIDAVISNRRFTLDSVDDLYIDDIVDINGDKVKIKSINGLNILTYTDVTPTPSVNDSLIKVPIQKAFFNNKELVIDRDWTYSNTTECILEIDPLAEFNIAPIRNLQDCTLTFTNGSRNVTRATGTVDLRTQLNPKDWIRINSTSHTTYYEICEVTETTIRLHANFGFTTAAYSCLYKPIELIVDDSLITVDCYGYMDNDVWFKTPSQCVQHILENDADLTQINQTLFDEASEDGNFIVSMVLPESVGDSGLPQIRDTISKINQSCFGSLFTDNDFNLAYSILNSEKPSGLGSIKDDDVISFSMDSKNNIINRAIVRYRPFTDINTGEQTFEQADYTNDFTSNVVEEYKTKELICYLYEEWVAQMIAERYCLFNSLTNSEVKVKAKLNLATKILNEKIYIQFDRLYKRFGGKDRKKIGIISGLSKNGYDTEVTFTDMGNIINRVPSIAPDTQSEYSTATEDEVLMYGFILDNTTETPDATNDNELGNCLIG